MVQLPLIVSEMHNSLHLVLNENRKRCQLQGNVLPNYGKHRVATNEVCSFKFRWNELVYLSVNINSHNQITCK